MNKQLLSIYKKETFSFFEGIQAWIILATYIILSMFITFFIGGFFSLNNAGLFSFFYFQPYILAFLIPAITMRLWAEERKNGTIEFLLTQPIPVFSIVIGKFLSAWTLCLCMMFLSFPLWIYLNLFFAADNLNILSGYLAYILLTGCFCAIGCLISSFCSSASVSYLWSLIVLFLFSMNDLSFIIKWLNLPQTLQMRLQNSLSLSSHYSDMISGQISLDNILFFMLLTVICISLNIFSVEYKKD